MDLGGLLRRRPFDLIVAMAITALGLPALLLPGPARTIVWLALLLVLPGYVTIAALFPTRWDMGWVERFALSLGFSIIVVPLLGLMLNFTPLGIRLVPVALGVVLFVGAVGAVAYLRRVHTPDRDRLRLDVGQVSTGNRRGWTLDRALAWGLAASLVAAGGLLAYVVTTPRSGEHFTEFYILDPQGRAEDYPTNLSAGATGTVQVVVVNWEGRSVTYSVGVELQSYQVAQNASGAEVRSLVQSSPLLERSIVVEDHARWGQNVTFSPPGPGLYRVEFDLFLGSDPAPYRQLHLWVTVH